MEITIKMTKKEGLFVSSIESGYQLEQNEGFGDSIESSLKDLAFRIENERIVDEQQKRLQYIQEKRPIAFELFSGLYEIMGDGWFEFRHLSNKLKEPKQIIITKLEFLIQFGYLISDRVSGTGMRFKLTSTEKEREAIFTLKIENYKKEIAACEDYINLSSMAVQA